MYYVYALLDPETNKPFYIGKGTGDRVHSHKKFRSGCKNLAKDQKIKEILATNQAVPYEIIKDGFASESDAYDFEEQLIEQIGLQNLTNVCESRRPPTQKGVKRAETTKQLIKKNSQKQGLARTVQHVKNNQHLFFNILTEISQGTRRETICSNYSVTVDLVNKIKRKYNLYIDLLNQHTDYKLIPAEIKKINGMKQKVYSDYRDVLIKMYNLIDNKVPRRKIAKILDISVEFYDRYKNQQSDFLEYLK